MPKRVSAEKIKEIKASLETELKRQIQTKTGLGQEMAYRLELQEENEEFTVFDYALAFFDIENWLIHSNTKLSDPMYKNLIEVKIKTGIVRELPREELDRTTVVGRGGKRSLYFIHNKKKWIQDFPDCYLYNEE